MTYDERRRLVIDTLVEVGREPILEHFTLDSCIASTRIALDVLEYFGVHGKALPLTMLLLNGEAISLIEGGMAMDDLGQHLLQYPADQEGGPWSIGLGAGGDPMPGKWAGHLVVELVRDRVLVDMSADQISRPHKQMHLEPMVWQVDDEPWWLGQETRSKFQVYENAAGHRLAVMFDREPPDPEGFKRTQNWRRKARGDTLVIPMVTAEIIRRIKTRLLEAKEATA